MSTLTIIILIFGETAPEIIANYYFLSWVTDHLQAIPLAPVCVQIGAYQLTAEKTRRIIKAMHTQHRAVQTSIY